MSDRSIICSNKATLAEFLDSFRMGASHRKDQAWNFQPHPSPSREERGLEIELITDDLIKYAYLTEPL